MQTQGRSGPEWSLYLQWWTDPFQLKHHPAVGNIVKFHELSSDTIIHVWSPQPGHLPKLRSLFAGLIALPCSTFNMILQHGGAWWTHMLTMFEPYDIHHDISCDVLVSVVTGGLEMFGDPHNIWQPYWWWRVMTTTMAFMTRRTRRMRTVLRGSWKELKHTSFLLERNAIIFAFSECAPSLFHGTQVANATGDHWWSLVITTSWVLGTPCLLICKVLRYLGLEIFAKRIDTQAHLFDTISL